MEPLEDVLYRELNAALDTAKQLDDVDMPCMEYAIIQTKIREALLWLKEVKK
jgi:hypothetical protein